MSDTGALETVGLHAIQQSTDRDVFVVGYPKSGNTWYQNLVAGVVFGCEPALAPDGLVQELVPNVHSKSFFRRFGDRAFFKSHHLPQREYRNVIYLVRDGRDVMVSYFHYLNALSATLVSFDHIVKDERLFPSKWHEHVNAWMANPFGARFMVVRYEGLKRDCLNELRRLCGFLEIEREESWLRLVAEETEFSRMQQKEAAQGWANTAWPKDRKFVRRRDIGSYRDEMPPEVLAYFLRDAGSTLATLGYLTASDGAAGGAAGIIVGEAERRIPTRPAGSQIAGNVESGLECVVPPEPSDAAAALAASSLEEAAQLPGCATAIPSAAAAEVQALVAQAQELLQAGHAVAAMRTAERAAQYGLPLPGLHYLRCLCFNAVGRHEEALEAARAEVAVNPEHHEARTEVEQLTKALRATRTVIPQGERPWHSALPRETLQAIQTAGHNYSYRGIPIIKNPFDFALYPLLLWSLKPRTIIEIGSKAGGSAVWLGDLLDNFGIDGHVHSIDIVRVTGACHPRVKFLEGDGRNLADTLGPQKLASLPRPWLVIEDADHSCETSGQVLQFFHPHLDAGDYIVVEDGIISDLNNDPECNSGPHRALKEFLALHDAEYEIDASYCDFFGYNLTWNTNGYLKKTAPCAALTLLDEPAPGPVVTANVAGVESEFEELRRVVSPYTMLSEEHLLSLYRLARRVCEENLPGNFVECGVAAGGSSALLACVIQRHSQCPRWVYACDSFAGLPPPTSDSHHAGQSAEAAGTCAAPEATLREVCSRLGVADLVKPVKGFFKETLPKDRDWFGMIAFLHMDSDWYESTHEILRYLYDRVVNDGIIQVDDYGFWAGCRKAIHEFEAQRGLRFPLQTIDSTGVWFRKPDRFPVNPVLPAELVEQFHIDDPDVPSQMSQNERYQLYHLVRTQLRRRLTPLRFVEIGSYAGASLHLIAHALGRTTKSFQGFAVEPAGQPGLHEVTKQLREHVIHVKALSHEAAPLLRQLFERDGHFAELIFIDGDHSCAGVKRDILDYYPLLSPGGVMAFHDYLPSLTPENRDAALFPHEGHEPGIRQACAELMEETYRCVVIESPLLHPTEPTQTQAHFPIIRGVFSTLRTYRKPGG